jgi:hypothetical protein
VTDPSSGNTSGSPSGSLPVSPASAVLGAGTALSMLLPGALGWESRALLAASTYAAAQAVDGDVVELWSVDGLGLGEEGDRAVRVATSTLSWVVATAVVVPVLRVLPLPRSVVALATGAAVAKANEVAMEKVRGILAAHAEPPADPA